MYTLFYSPLAKKDSKKIEKSGLKQKVIELLNIIEINPYAYPPEFEFLQGKLKGYISRRINKQHRLIYKVDNKNHIIKIVRMWTHYGN